MNLMKTESTERVINLVKRDILVSMIEHKELGIVCLKSRIYVWSLLSSLTALLICSCLRALDYRMIIGEWFVQGKMFV